MNGNQRPDEHAECCRETLETAVFDALDGVYRLPPEDAIATAGLVAGQIAAFLADMAQLSSSAADMTRAQRALSDLICDCEELAGEIRRARAAARWADEAGAPQAAAEMRDRGASGHRVDDDHNITHFKPRFTLREPGLTRT